eukprot:2722532-Rhodomonas_salina.3
MLLVSTRHHAAPYRSTILHLSTNKGIAGTRRHVAPPVQRAAQHVAPQYKAHGNPPVQNPA